MEMTIQNFMSRVVPWPNDGPGFTNLHWTTAELNRQGKPFWGGKPYKDVEKFLGMAKWAVKQPRIKDLYFCLSQQSTATVTKENKPKVLRLAENAMGLKSIWLDVDVKAPPKGYATLGEAIDAINAFIHAAALPRPTALVASGGGVHVYWISDKVLSPEEWQGYANGLRALAEKHGLRADLGCTIDRARVLRIPFTLNWKTTPPKPTKLLYLLEADYDFSTVLSWLPALAPIASLAESTLSPFDLSKFPKRFSETVVESLGEGLEREEMPPLDWKPLIGQCGFITEALKTGGKDYDQPQWNLTTLAATFLESGQKLAHKMGNKHPTYDQGSTDTLWERKLRERKDRGIGWPSCSAIQAAGSKSCAACPHLGRIKSPLNLTAPVSSSPVAHPTVMAGSPVVTATVIAPMTVPMALFSGLTYGFIVDKAGEVCRLLEGSNK